MVAVHCVQNWERLIQSSSTTWRNALSTYWSIFHWKLLKRVRISVKMKSVSSVSNKVSGVHIKDLPCHLRPYLSPSILSDEDCDDLVLGPRCKAMRYWLMRSDKAPSTIQPLQENQEHQGVVNTLCVCSMHAYAVIPGRWFHHCHFHFQSTDWNPMITWAKLFFPGWSNISNIAPVCVHLEARTAWELLWCGWRWWRWGFGGRRWAGLLPKGFHLWFHTLVERMWSVKYASC